MISHQPRNFLPVDGDFEVDQRFVRIDAHAVGGETVVHDLQELFRVCFLRREKEEVIGLSQQEALTGLKKVEMTGFEISVEVVAK